ncbi:MAG: nucleotide exchange factor GrpE, partial [Pseudomonas paracarnis]
MADEQTQDTQTPDANSAAGDELATRVQVLEEQLAAAQDQSLRVAADLQNVRRRAEQDVEKAHKFALEKFAGDLLPIIDSLERGLELSNPDDENIRPMREGIEL